MNRHNYTFVFLCILLAMMGSSRYVRAQCVLIPPSTVTIGSITCSTANASWMPSPTAIGYEYVVSTSSATPGGPGTPTGGPSASITSLLASTTYYFFVKPICTAGVSTWTGPISFTTTSCSTSCTAPASITGTPATCDSANLSWSTVTGATGYEFAVNTTGTAPSSGSPTTSTTAPVWGLSASTVYYAYVRTNCGSSSYSSWTSSTFTTPACSTSCTAPTVTGSAISCDSATISWTGTSSSGFEYVVNTSSTAPSGSGTASSGSSATVSGLAASTSYHAWVRKNCGGSVFSSWASATFSTPACSTACTAPAVTASPISCDSVAISWTGTSTLGFEYAVTTSATAPSGSGTAVTGSSVSAGGLSATTVYYAWVRKKCSSSTFSSWASSMFTTPACGTCMPPTGLSKTASPTSVIVNWSVVTGAMGYEYVVNPSTADPTGSGTATTTTSNMVSGLTPSTMYYLHVRTKCAGGVFSAWTSASSFSTKPTGVTSVNPAEGGLNAYPSPLTNILTIETGNTANTGLVQVYDMDGRLVAETMPAGGKAEVDMSKAAPGIYLVRYTDSEHTQAVRVTKL